MMEALQTSKVLKLDSREQSVLGECISSDSNWGMNPGAIGSQLTPASVMVKTWAWTRGVKVGRSVWAGRQKV